MASCTCLDYALWLFFSMRLLTSRRSPILKHGHGLLQTQTQTQTVKAKVQIGKVPLIMIADVRDLDVACNMVPYIWQQGSSPSPLPGGYQDDYR